MQSHFIFTCYPWMRHNIPTLWNQKRKISKKSLEAAVTSVTLLKPSTYQLYLKRLLVGEQLLVSIYNGNLERLANLYDRSIFVRRLPELYPTFNPRLYHLHQLQRSIIVFTCSIQVQQSKGTGDDLLQRNGYGKRAKKHMSQLPVIYWQCLIISCIFESEWSPS